MIKGQFLPVIQLFASKVKHFY